MEERNIKISIDKARDWYNRGGECKELALSAFSEEEIKANMLPNTWEEFCEMYPVEEDGEEWYIDVDSNTSYVYKGARNPKFYRNVLPSLKAAEAHCALMQLHQLRDCYRQGWIPDYTDAYDKFCIIRQFNFHSNKFEYEIINFFALHHFLSFQSEEIAEEFLKNFRDLIEQAGDLI